MGQQRDGRLAVVLVRRHLVGVAGRIDGAGVASATAAADHPGDGFDEGPVETPTSALADETVERRVSHAVQGGEQQ